MTTIHLRVTQTKNACGTQYDVSSFWMLKNFLSLIRDEVVCPKCLQSEEYKNDLILLEIGCDGDWEKFDKLHSSIFNKRVHTK